MKRVPTPAAAQPVPEDPWAVLKRHTDARIGLGRAGGSLPTQAQLEFQLAHARARDAVHQDLDIEAVTTAFEALHGRVLRLHSAAQDRIIFVQRPDLGRVLNEPSKALMSKTRPPAEAYDAAFIIADGLSALAVERHAAPFLGRVWWPLEAAGWRLAPLCIVQQGRVAIGDEIGLRLPARLVAVLIGERPGLSSPDSLGVYLTWDPRPGRTNAERNCISNIRPQGLNYAAAAHKLLYLMQEARRRRLTGVALKEEASTALPDGAAKPPDRITPG